MKQLILVLHDSNMAGYSWRWCFYLERQEDGRYALTGEQDEAVSFGPDGERTRDEQVETVAPIPDLRDGADVYEALATMLSDQGYSINNYDLGEIAQAISAVDPAAAEQFLHGEELLESRAGQGHEQAMAERDAALAPFRDKIDQYVCKLQETRRLPFGVPRRTGVKQFMEDYVLTHGKLPTGKHRIETRLGWLSFSEAEHDFGDLS
jgi:hypothetical protein